MERSLKRQIVLFVECDEIESGLYLGNIDAVKDPNVFKKFGITHVLTAYSFPVTIPEDTPIKTFFLEVDDNPEEDLLSNFNKTNDFIKDGQKEGACLVHCFGGISRSATLVIAYLMNKYGISYKEAKKRVKEKRFFICPNGGFVSQLCLYEAMKFCLDESNIRYKLFLLEHIMNEVTKENCFAKAVLYAAKALEREKNGNQFKCKTCRHTLFYESNLLYHFPNRNLMWEDERLEHISEFTVCTESVYVEPLQWMSDAFVELSGKILCPKCQNKLGTFSWAGQSCQCLATVAPSFRITESKVDKEELHIYKHTK